MLGFLLAVSGKKRRIYIDHEFYLHNFHVDKIYEIESPKWYIDNRNNLENDNSSEYEMQKNRLTPDILKVVVHENIRCLLILDAKYYNLRIENEYLKGNPGVDDITKQYLYHTALKSYIEKNNIKTMSDGNIGIYWSNLNSTKGIGVQIGTTADLFLSDEISEGGTLGNTRVSYYSKLETAVQDIGLNIDYVIIDELPAKQLIKNNMNLNYVPLYYEGEEDIQACDSYAIAVTKGHDQLFKTINDVLNEMLNTFDENGINTIEQLINKYLGL